MVPPPERAEEDGPDADTAPLSGGPAVLPPPKDHDTLADAEDDEDDDDDD